MEPSAKFLKERNWIREVSFSICFIYCIVLESKRIPTTIIQLCSDLDSLKFHQKNLIHNTAHNNDGSIALVIDNSNQEDMLSMFQWKIKITS